MGKKVEEGATGRGAAGGDVRFSDVPRELIEACKKRLDALLEDETAATPIFRKLRSALQRELFALPVISTTLSRVLGLLAKDGVTVSELAIKGEGLLLSRQEIAGDYIWGAPVKSLGHMSARTASRFHNRYTGRLTS